MKNETSNLNVSPHRSKPLLNVWLPALYYFVFLILNQSYSIASPNNTINNGITDVNQDQAFSDKIAFFLIGFLVGWLCRLFIVLLKSLKEE